MKEIIISHVQSFLLLYPHIAYLIIFSGIFFSAMFPTSLFLYGEFIFIPAGILIGLGQLKLFEVLISSLFGALFGDMVNYYLGYKYGRSFFKPGRRFLNEETLERGEVLFQKYGIWGILLAKFVPLVPWTASFLAGLHRTNLFIFIIIDIFFAAVVFGIIYGGLSSGSYFIGQILSFIK